MKYGCFFVVVIILLGAGCGGYYWYTEAHAPPEWFTEEVDQGDIRQSISATGSLSAVETVEVGCQISGIISSISVDFNDNVKVGQLLAVIDPSTYEAQVQQSTANLESAKASERNMAAQIDNLRATVLNSLADLHSAEANVRKTEVAIEDAERNFRRIKELFDRKLVATSDLDSAKTALDTQKAMLDAAKSSVEGLKAKQESIKAQIESAKAQHDGTFAQIRQNEAQLKIANINLSRTNIFSPIDGVIISRAIDAGQTVAASLQAPKLFVIANDLRKMQIDTALDEADIGKVREGQHVTFTVDAYKGRTFKGKVKQVRLSPTVSSNVVTYSVMIDVDNEELSLKPGMTANVEILVDQRKDVTRVPAKALFFKPPKTMNVSESRNVDENATNSARVWTLASDSTLVGIEISTGISDSKYTEVLSDTIKPGQLLIIAEKKAGDKSPTTTATSSGGKKQGGSMRLRIH